MRNQIRAFHSVLYFLLVNVSQNISDFISFANLQVSISQVFFEHFNKRNGGGAVAEELYQVRRESFLEISKTVKVICEIWESHL